MSFLKKCPSVARRSTICILRVLTRQFMAEFERLRGLNIKQKVFQKLMRILDCIELILQ